MNMSRGSFRAGVVLAAAASMLALAGGVKAQDSDANNNVWPYAMSHRSPVLAVVGDVACQPGETEPTGEAAHEACNNPKAPYGTNSLWQSQEATAKLIETMKPDLVALLGDLQYQVGQYQDFEGSFNLTYGAFKFLHRPSPGNHEFYNEHSATGVAGYGYFSYYNGFQVDTNGNPVTVTLGDPCPSTMTGCSYTGLSTTNSQAQPVPLTDGQAGHFEPTGGVGATIPPGGTVGVGDGWYSYNVGSWHLISLNIECETQPGGCSPTGSWFAAQLSWLKHDLEENRSECTAAYWHQPTFSAADSISEEGVTAQAFWELLYQYNADLILNGHDHLYARYRPLDPAGNPDSRRGIREFIVGTGGETLDTVVTSDTTAADPTGNVNFNAQNLEKASGDFWGVMALTLGDHGYQWNFQTALELPGDAAGPFSDSGAAACHGGHGW